MMGYRRYQGKSYLILSEDAADADGFEYPMLTGNSIAGLLPFKRMNADCKMQFWYDISGRQSLEDWLKIKKDGSGFLKNFISALAETLERLCEYLLYEDGICLSPDKIFVNAEGDEILFCYRPFQKEPFDAALCGFMEYYLSHMQHGDREEMQKCYDVYEKCQQKNAKLEDLLKILFREPERTEEPPKKNRDEERTESKFLNKESAGKEILQKLERRKWRRQFFFTKRWKKKVSAEPYVFEPKEYPAKPQSQTVFLGSETEEIIGELKYEGAGAGGNFKLEKQVFLIGSQHGEADGKISDDTVSRMHARITKEEGNYYLEDLNSTNGTYRNGEILTYKEKVKLEKNDKITFAKEAYRFV